MKIVKFPQCNTVYAENQPRYLLLPAHRTKSGIVISCWELSILERLKVLVTGKVYLALMTFKRPLQPQLMSTKFSSLLEE